MSDFIISRLNSFKHALQGWWHVIRTQKNAWIHSLATLLAVLVGLLVKLTMLEWAILIVTICMVWMAEFLNTALEAVVDLASPSNHPLAKVGKDVGAAAVLIAAVTSVVVGVLILGRPLLALVVDR